MSDASSLFVERRKLLGKADAIVNRAERENRELAAGEHAKVDGALTEVRELTVQILSMPAETGAYQVPETQRSATAPTDWSRRGTGDRGAIDPRCPVLTREQRTVDYLAALGRGAAYEPITGRFCVGELVLSSLTGNRDRLSDAERRALEAGTGVSGGFILEGQPAGMMIDLLRPATRVLQAGASVVPMTEGTLKLAKVTAAGQPTWHVENSDDIADSGLTFGAITLVTKTLPVIATASVELVEDLNSSMLAQAIEQQLIKAIAQELDRSLLRGTGLTTEHIQGLLHKSGVTKTELGSGNGLETADFDWVVEAIGRVWAQNLDPTGWVTSSPVATVIEKYKSSVDSQPLRAPQAVENLPRFITNQVPADLTVGSSTDCSEAYFGNWPDMLVGMRTNMRVEATRTGGDAFKKMQVLIRAYLLPERL